ncbi:MAG: HupE/UreJ family protein [Gammaproteobacteria bacterium]|nr:HupE/UreJ family protein [Gammaproteobacteria bacterium]
MSSIIKACLFGLVLLLNPSALLAHGGFGSAELIYDGMLHILLNVQYVLTLTACALLVSQSDTGEHVAALAQPAIVLGIITGTVVALANLDGWLVVYLSRSMMVILGILVASSFKITRSTLLFIVAVTGLVTGLELTTMEPHAESPVMFAIGAIIGGVVVHGSASRLAMISNARLAKIMVRIAGSWIAAIGIIITSFMFVVR